MVFSWRPIPNRLLLIRWTVENSSAASAIPLILLKIPSPRGNAAAARAGALLSKEATEEKAYLAYVIKRLCCGCGLCVSVCPYGARVLNEEEGKAEVIGSLCQGCASCVIACRNGASQQRNFEKDLNLAALDAVID
jgi:heterodisulfide reductase subunit A